MDDKIWFFQGDANYWKARPPEIIIGGGFSDLLLKTMGKEGKNPYAPSINQVGNNLDEFVANAADSIISRCYSDPLHYGIISVQAYLEDGSLTISVEDNGVGLPEGFSIKDACVSSKNSNDYFGSHGIGLSRAKKEISALGGNLGFERISEGACFRMEIPYSSMSIKKN
jgi:sensor histidine kinase regulating citrate/malate metabolism